MLDKDLILNELEPSFSSIKEQIKKNQPISKFEFIEIAPSLFRFVDEDFLGKIASNFGIRVESRVDEIKEEEDKSKKHKIYTIHKEILTELSSISKNTHDTKLKYDYVTNEVINIIKNLNLNSPNKTINSNRTVEFVCTIFNDISNSDFFNKTDLTLKELKEILSLNPMLFERISTFEEFIEEFKSDIRDYANLIIQKDKIYFMYPIQVEGYSRVLPILVSVEDKIKFQILNKNTLLGFNDSNFEVYKIRI
jgi:hypothetical protein